MTNERINHAAEALVAKALADAEAMEAIEDNGGINEDEWDALWDESLGASEVIAGVVKRVEGTPEQLARTVFESIDREELARVLAHLEPGEDWPTNEALGGSMTGTRDDEFHEEMLEQATAIRAWLLSEGGA